jgi:multimeric flavodoxin WrbA
MIDPAALRKYQLTTNHRIGGRMKIVSLLGSPRSNGNSTAIARRFTETAESLGAETKTFELNRLTYRGCQGCYACKTKLDTCVVEDDLTEVLEAVKEADVLLLASPVYYGDVTAQLKGFLDRTFSYLVPDYFVNPQPSRLIPGKKLVFVSVQGHPDQEKFGDVFPRYDSFLRWYGFGESRLIRACGLTPKTDAKGRGPYLEQAEEAARGLAG